MRASLVLLGLAACVSSPPPAPSTSPRACTELEQRTFSSLVQLECGLGPDGPVPCNWQLGFDVGDPGTSTLHWAHSDVGETLRVHCNDTGDVVSDTPAYTGRYDVQSRMLTWEDVVYAE